ncbi:hypothetical protein GCM10009595_16710 [Falsarthrobacter nasiphocae]
MEIRLRGARQFPQDAQGLLPGRVLASAIPVLASSTLALPLSVLPLPVQALALPVKTALIDCAHASSMARGVDTLSPHRLGLLRTPAREPLGG